MVTLPRRPRRFHGALVIHLDVDPCVKPPDESQNLQLAPVFSRVVSRKVT